MLHQNLKKYSYFLMIRDEKNVNLIIEINITYIIKKIFIF